MSNKCSKLKFFNDIRTEGKNFPKSRAVLRQWSQYSWNIGDQTVLDKLLLHHKESICVL